MNGAAAGDIRPMRILAVGPDDSPHLGTRLAAFARLGHEVYCMGNLGREVPGVRPLTIRGLDTGDHWRLCAASRILRFHRLVSQVNPDVVHVHFAQGMWNWLCGTLNRPLVVTVMGGDVLFDEQGNQPNWKREATLTLLRRADLITAKSDFLAERLQDLRLPADRTITVRWGVDESLFRPMDGAPMRRELGLTGDDLAVLSPRGLRPLYNNHRLVEAMPELLRRSSTAVLLILDFQADADYREQLLSRARELGVENRVRLVPACPRERMPDLYAAADLVASVPDSDGLPMTLLEAMACARPVLATNLDRYTEAARHGEHFWTTPLDPASLVEAMARLLTDPALRASLSEGGLRQSRALPSLECDAQRVARLMAGLRIHAGALSARLKAAYAIPFFLKTTNRVVATSGQPVYGSARAYFNALAGRSVDGPGQENMPKTGTRGASQ